MIGILVLLAVITLVTINHVLSRMRLKPVRTNYDYDAIVVGGSIAGPVVAKALSAQNRKVLLLERALFTKPDRIVGELLQPGGINALKQVNMEGCATSVGMPCDGYLVVDGKGHQVKLPYRAGFQGYSFHFGEFVNNLRENVWLNCAENVTMLEATVNEVLLEKTGLLERAYGVAYSIAADYKVPEAPFKEDTPVDRQSTTTMTDQRVATAPLIIMCDGGSSKFKAKYQHYTPARQYHSNFIGLVVRNAQLPVEKYGTVFFGKTGPILSYRLDPKELRMLVDYNKPTLPGLEQQSKWLIEEVAPCLPVEMRSDFISAAKDTCGIRSMPVARYPPTFPSIRGYVGLGDHANQRHPLTGGGMTCAFNDSLLLAKNLADIPSLRSSDINEMAEIEDGIQAAILNYTQRRFWHCSCINILSWALYAVFSIPALRDACFDYFMLGGDCVDGPMSLLSGLEPGPFQLLFHYYRVMVYGVFNMLTGSGVYSCHGTMPSLFQKCFNMVTFVVNPFRIAEALRILIVATLVVVPLAYQESVSFWRLMDPTSLVANVVRKIKILLYRAWLDGKKRKPVGI
ncbi:squalene monooxygenase-like protein [Trypanosoma rangeli]|uniref:Squalene monooxygenase n=1 Tax=Trypanosoma rangeli TaxID=5698 RepID=A0A422P4A3_TRYRA|nr:squalene monooxygenase-like protein [Trypanosoma rangeli]RNF12553.1 squalene monooxygenase-like protein [Trypanosoma rangeli]|eukprot:RNF12553.1 squalene monooxygenase-like protein [Trypanosoma rangeli]